MSIMAGDELPEFVDAHHHLQNLTDNPTPGSPARTSSVPSPETSPTSSATISRLICSGTSPA